MPFFTLDNEDAVTKVANYKKYTDMSIMSEYAALIEKYAQSEKADEDRIKRLAAEIVYSDKFKDLSEQEGDQVITMQEIAKADKKTAKVVHMEFKEETTEDHPFTDFMDTIDKTTVYVSRYQKIEGTDGIDMVLGSQDVSYSNISNQKESIDIVTDVLSNLYGYQVYGTQDEKWVYDWAHLSELEKDEDSKRTYIGNLVNQLKTSNATDDETKKVDYDAVKWLSFGGKFGKAEDDATTYKDACLYFYNTIKDGVESYAFAGATYSGETGEVTATKETLMGIGQDYSVLQFYHYMIFGGEETKIEDIAETSFVAPTLKMEDVSIYKTALAYVDSQYNDYTVGFTSVSGVDEAGKETDPKQYILDSGQCKEDASEYQKNDKQVGNEIPSSSENGLTTISGQNTNSQPPVKGMEVEATTASGETLTTIMTPEVSPMPEVTAVPDTATVPEVTITPESTTTPEPTVTATPTVVAAPTNTAVSEITTTESTTTETTAPETTTTEDSSTEENSTPEPAPIEAIPTTETTVIEMAPPMEPAA